MKAMMFWIIASALGLLVATLFILALFRSASNAEHPAAYDLRVYRDQLKEVERDLARGVLGQDDAERIRAEVGRRVLAADAQLKKAEKGSPQPQGATVAAAALSTIALTAGGLLIYTNLGSPSQADMPHAARLSTAQTLYESRASQAEFVAKLPARATPQPDEGYANLIAQLRTAVADNPDDAQGQQFLATNEARLGNFEAAIAAQQAVIRIKGEAAVASDHLALAQIYLTQAQGYIAPEAEAALRAALAHTPDHPVARYFLGQLWLQNDRPDRTFALWSRLLTQGPEEAPWIAPIRRSIDDIAWLAGVDYTQPAPAQGSSDMPGPSVEDIENAGQMSPEERQDMIRGMVSRLSDRLATEGGTPEEWARLISAYGSLGEEARARAIWNEAQMRFADKPDALETVRRGAQRAGVDQ